jgi:hypothetical protein
VSHAEFLRDQWPQHESTVIALIQGLDGIASASLERTPADSLARVDAFLDALADLEPGDRQILSWIARATWGLASLGPEHLAPLRAAGLADRELHDLAQVCACFQYMNRVADMLGVGLLPDRYPFARKLFGEDRLQEHLAWATSG